MFGKNCFRDILWITCLKLTQDWWVKVGWPCCHSCWGWMMVPWTSTNCSACFCVCLKFFITYTHMNKYIIYKLLYSIYYAHEGIICYIIYYVLVYISCSDITYTIYTAYIILHILIHYCFKNKSLFFICIYIHAHTYISISLYLLLVLSLWRTLSNITNRISPLISWLFLRRKKEALSRSYESGIVELGILEIKSMQTCLLFRSHPTRKWPLCFLQNSANSAL